MSESPLNPRIKAIANQMAQAMLQRFQNQIIYGQPVNPLDEEIKPIKWRWIDKRIGKLEGETEYLRYTLDFSALDFRCKARKMSMDHNNFHITLKVEDGGITFNVGYTSRIPTEELPKLNSLYKDWLNYLILKGDK